MRKFTFIAKAGLCLLLLTTPSANAASSGELRNFLTRFIGVWEGEFFIQKLDGEVLQKFPARNTFTWEETPDKFELKGNAVFSIGDKMELSESTTYLKDGQVISEITQNDKTTVFSGTVDLEKLTVTWVPYDEDGIPGQKTIEKILYDEDGTHILTSGFETVPVDDSLVTFAIKGSVRRLAFHPDNTDR